MEIYGEEWAANYERRANAGIPGREGLYRLCQAFFLGLPAQARILVVGCGTEDDLIPLAKAFPEASLVAIEPAEPMLAYCSRRVAAEGLANRVTLHPTSLQNFESSAQFDAATAILVSQHIFPDVAAAEFFQKIASLLKPNGRLYSADLHIGAGQDRELLLALWREQASMSGIEPAVVQEGLVRFTTELRPRDEAVIYEFLRAAGFVNILKPFSSLIYGAWASSKGA